MSDQVACFTSQRGATKPSHKLCNKAASQRRDLMVIIKDCYLSGASLVARQLLVDTWPNIIDEVTQSGAIIDHLTHNARRLPFDGPSMRKTRDAPRFQSH